MIILSRSPLKVGKDKSLRVKVVKIHPLENPPEENVEKKMEGACDSPSSDKENASQENLKKEPQSKEEESRRESLCKTYLLFVFIHDVFQCIQNDKIIMYYYY